MLSKIKLKISVKKSEPACMQCLPPGSLRDHAAINGILIHSRIDCPDGILYAISEKDLTKSKI